MLARALACWRHPFARFLVVGALNTAFGWSVYAALILAGLARPLSLLLATIVGVLFNFQTIGRVVFGNTRARLLPRFIATYAGVYVFNLGLLEAICRWIGASSLVGQLIALPPTVLVAFHALRHFVFRHRHDCTESQAG